jgi:[protein-PII] uridylyltransferase
LLKELSRGNTIQVFKNAILRLKASLEEKFKNDEKIADLLESKDLFIDMILKYAWNQFRWDKKISLLAVGGYGRGELHPHSDIDLMILVSSNKINLYQKNIEAFLAFLWDIQLKIGHSVRSISDCVSAAKNDVTIATNIMETRTICGEDIIRNNMLKKISPDRIWPLKLWPSNEFFRRLKLSEQTNRHAKHGNTEYNLEPNIKEAPGGLKRYTNYQLGSEKTFWSKLIRRAY